MSEIPTIWNPRGSIEGEFDPSSNFDLADSSGNLLVDSSSVFLISGDSAFTLINGTVWTGDDGA